MTAEKAVECTASFGFLVHSLLILWYGPPGLRPG
jgi:nitrate reductase NapE component